MGRWKLWFVLLLLLTFSVDSREKIAEIAQELVKTIRRAPEVTPICTNSTQHIITLIVCRIRTERSGEECHLLYRHGEDFVHECDSRFTLRMENQTVFLHLTSLTPVDRGKYTCQCSHSDGTFILHLNMEPANGTVEEDEDASSSSQIPFHNAVITGVFIFIIITGAILGFIYRKNHHRTQSEQLTSHANTEPEDIEPYSTYIQRENELYSMCSFHVTQI